MPFTSQLTWGAPFGVVKGANLSGIPAAWAEASNVEDVFWNGRSDQRGLRESVRTQKLQIARMDEHPQESLETIVNGPRLLTVMENRVLLLRWWRKGCLQKAEDLGFHLLFVSEARQAHKHRGSEVRVGVHPVCLQHYSCAPVTRGIYLRVVTS